MDSIERFAKLYACIVSLGSNVAYELKTIEPVTDRIVNYVPLSMSLYTLFSLAHAALDAYEHRHDTEIARIKRDKSYSVSSRRALIAATIAANAEPFHLSDFAPKF